MQSIAVVFAQRRLLKACCVCRLMYHSGTWHRICENLSAAPRVRIDPSAFPTPTKQSPHRPSSSLRWDLFSSSLAECRHRRPLFRSASPRASSPISCWRRSTPPGTTPTSRSPPIHTQLLGRRFGDTWFKPFPEPSLRPDACAAAVDESGLINLFHGMGDEPTAACSVCVGVLTSHIMSSRPRSSRMIARSMRGSSSRQRDCHSADAPSPCLLKYLLQGEGDVAE